MKSSEGSGPLNSATYRSNTMLRISDPAARDIITTSCGFSATLSQKVTSGAKLVAGT